MTGAKRLQPRRLRGTPWSPTLVIFRVAVSAPSESLNSAKTWSAPWSFFSSAYWGVYKIGVEVSLGTFAAFRFRRIALRLNPILMVVGSRSSVSFNWSWGIVLCSQSLNWTSFCGWFDRNLIRKLVLNPNSFLEPFWICRQYWKQDLMWWCLMLKQRGFKFVNPNPQISSI